MNKYIAGWDTNGGSTYGSFEGNNLSKMRKEVRNTCSGNTFAGNTGSWKIDYLDVDARSDTPILQGRVK